MDLNAEKKIEEVDGCDFLSFSNLFQSFNTSIFHFNYIQVMYRLQPVPNRKRVLTEVMGLLISFFHFR